MATAGTATNQRADVDLNTFPNGQPIEALVGNKYLQGGSRLVTSPRSEGLKGRASAEIYEHAQLDCLSFVQPVTEIVINIGGTANFRRKADGPEQKYLSQVGSSSICPAGVSVKYLHIENGPIKMLHIYLPVDLFGTLRCEDGSAEGAGLVYRGGISDPLIQSIGFAVAEELMGKKENIQHRLLLDSFAIGLSARLLQRYTKSERASLSEPYFDAHSGKGLDRVRLARVIDFIQTHIDMDVSLDDLANIACLSVFHFCRAFKIATGASPFQYISEVRLRQVKVLLRDPIRTIDDIALSTGFSSGANLARAFKKSVGVSPTQYRIEQVWQ